MDINIADCCHASTLLDRSDLYMLLCFLYFFFIGSEVPFFFRLLLSQVSRPSRYGRAGQEEEEEEEPLRSPARSTTPKFRCGSGETIGVVAHHLPAKVFCDLHSNKK